MAPGSSRAVLVGGAALTVHTISAFAPPINSQHRAADRAASPATARGASVYYPDGSCDDSAGDDPFGPQRGLGFGPRGLGSALSDASYDGASATEDIFDPTTLSSASGIFGRLAEHLSSDPNVSSALARVASAFSPPGFLIELASINEVRCCSVDNCHLEIEAVVCDDIECSSLLVPVDFPQACDLDEGLEDCILRNIQCLNEEGEHVLQERGRVFAEEEEAQRAYEVLQSLDSEYLKSAPIALPSWWEAPLSAAETEECTLLQSLLNGDDFRQDMRGLAELAMLHNAADLEGKAIRSVRVKALGPAGMVLKVQLSLNGRTGLDEGGLTNESVVDVPVEFAEMSPGGERGSVREEVLALVSVASAT